MNPGRDRDTVYFDTEANIAKNSFYPATCKISGGGSSGPLTCSIPRQPAVSTLCLYGNYALIIRDGPCDPSMGEAALRVTATVR